VKREIRKPGEGGEISPKFQLDRRAGLF